MSTETKAQMDTLLVFILCAWALSLPFSINTDTQSHHEITPKAPQTVIVNGVPMGSNSDALIDYFASGTLQEEQETVFEKLDNTFTPYTIDTMPITTSPF